MNGLVGATTAGPHVYLDSFPDHAEYDANILDPHHVYGSPFGGFSRATRSRLASLPLYLPEISGELGDSDPMFMEVRDDTGRLFACRVYHEDELLRDSLGESMFDTPKLRNSADDESPGLAKESSSALEEALIVSSVSQRTRAVHHATDDRNAVPVAPSPIEGSRPSTDQSPSGAEHEINDSPFPSPFTGSNAASVGASGVIGNEKQSHRIATVSGDPKDPEVKLLAIKMLLRELTSICGQIHKGWWSYEWCFEQTITQFHIEYDTVKNQVQIESVTDLGTFVSRSVLLDLDDSPPNEWAEETPEIARVIDIHDGGGTCLDTGKSRRTYVHLLCCSDNVNKIRKGMLHRDGHQIASDIAAVLDVHEDPAHVCTYNVTICTPLLCGAPDNVDDATSVVGAATAPSQLMAATSAGLELGIPKENESIREILDRALSQMCLQTNTGGWWVYEICHKQSIRQFHEAPAVVHQTSTGVKVTASTVESEHFLGLYDATTAEVIPDHEEWKLVVNVTTNGVGSGKEWGGAYYEVEYTGGDVCDHSDVTNAAIVAGSAGAGGGVERASTVRFYCGQSYDVSVREDSTCHYVVQVEVPALCKHPLFRAPVSKKQVMKCLPVEE